MNMTKVFMIENENGTQFNPSNIHDWVEWRVFEWRFLHWQSHEIARQFDDKAFKKKTLITNIYHPPPHMQKYM